MQPGTQRSLRIKMLLISKNRELLVYCYYRYPFVATDILTSCMKIADKMIETIENPDEEQKRQEAKAAKQE
jgi:hypothetical protein